MFKDKKKGMNPMHKNAKMGVLQEIRKMAMGEMGKDLHGLKKVTVAAPDEEGLKMGLDKAGEMVGGEHKMPDGNMMNDSDMSGAEDMSDEMELSEGNLSPEEMATLKQLLLKMKG